MGWRDQGSACARSAWGLAGALLLSTCGAPGEMTTEGTISGVDPSAGAASTLSTGSSASSTGPQVTDSAGVSTGEASSSSSATGEASGTAETSETGAETTGVPGPMCGNGVLEPENGEQCDDGDAVDNNACSNSCQPVPCDEQVDAFAQILSYIWIANSSQNTVSKINTETAVEVGRYHVEGGSPSRTSVNLRGDVAVSSRDPGGVTKIAAKLEDCVDKNQNGEIETSSGPGDVLPPGTDECVLWQKPVPSPGFSFGPRATAWVAGEPDPETCEYPEPLLWVGWKDDRNIAHFLKIDGETGDTLVELEYPWGPEFAPYGGAVDAEGNFYAVGLNDMPTVKIDFVTHEIEDLGNPEGCKYGMTLDPAGVLWAGTCSGEGVYYRDPELDAWVTLPGPGGGRVNGVMADAAGNVWGAGSDPCRLVHIDAASKTYVNNNIPLPGCQNPWGVSIDYQGYVWIVDMSANRAFKINPDSYQVVAEVAGLVNPYTYSDMTGVALKNQIVPE